MCNGLIGRPMVQPWRWCMKLGSRLLLMAGEVHDGDDGIALQMVIHECNQVAFGWVSDPSRMTMTNTQVLNNLATQTTLPQNPTWKDLRLRRGLLLATWRHRWTTRWAAWLLRGSACPQRARANCNNDSFARSGANRIVSAGHHPSGIQAKHGHSFPSYSSACSGNRSPQRCFPGSKHSAPICFSEEPSRATIQVTRNCACAWRY